MFLFEHEFVKINNYLHRRVFAMNSPILIDTHYIHAQNTAHVQSYA